MGNSEKSQFSSTSPPGFPLNPTNQKSNDFHQRPREPSKSNFEGLTPQGYSTEINDNLIFISADADLNDMARAEGLVVEDLDIL